jgi:hypothetical protein
MSLTVTQRPSTTIGGNTSRWNAAKNPIVYKMTRKDYNITALANSGGALQITVNTNLTTLTSAQGGPVVAGAKIWVVTDNGAYNALYTVVSVTNVANSVVTFSAGTYTVAATTGYINLMQRTNYRVQVGIYNAANSLISTLAYSPDKSGNVIIDVSTPLLNTLSVDNLADYVTGFVTQDETTAYVKFYIRYTELWTNSAETETNDSANQFFALYGARQIGDLYGGNLAEYVNYDNGNPLAKFLTRFERPSIWRGYPFSIHTITSDNQVTDSNFRLQYFDRSGTSISSVQVTRVPNSGKLLRFSPNNALAIPTNAATCQIQYNTQIVLPGPVFVTVNQSQIITCDIKEACSNPVLLWWRASNGGDAWWMFQFNQSYSYRYDNGRKAKRYVLFASNLSLNEFDSINELNTLGDVYEPAYTELTTSINKSQARIGSQVYMMDATGKKTGVIVIPTEPSTKTRFNLHKIQITIELPEIY